MKKYIILLILIVSCICSHYYLIIKQDMLVSRMRHGDYVPDFCHELLSIWGWERIVDGSLIFLIGISPLVYWYSNRNDYPTHPKLFWTLLFGWLYIFYYICEKKNL